jgi:IS30 family transposase
MSRCYTQITLADRRRLHHLVTAKVPVNEMALAWISDQPRKCLGCRTPAEVFMAHLQEGG